MYNVVHFFFEGWNAERIAFTENLYSGFRNYFVKTVEEYVKLQNCALRYCLSKTIVVSYSGTNRTVDLVQTVSPKIFHIVLTYTTTSFFRFYKNLVYSSTQDGVSLDTGTQVSTTPNDVAVIGVSPLRSLYGNDLNGHLLRLALTRKVPILPTTDAVQYANDNPTQRVLIWAHTFRDDLPVNILAGEGLLESFFAQTQASETTYDILSDQSNLIIRLTETTTGRQCTTLLSCVNAYGNLIDMSQPSGPLLVNDFLTGRIILGYETVTSFFL
jgi:hypothetical protein